MDRMRLTEFCGERLTTQEIAAIKGLSVDGAEPLLNLRHGAEPRITYRRRTLRLRTCLHLGQTKLAVGLLRFLLEYGRLAKTVLYVGAAPGTNIVEIAKLFPEHRFVLYDPAPFRLNLENEETAISKRFSVYREFFTNETAKKWANRVDGLLFVSDIRTGNSNNELQREVLKNMAMQRVWYDILGKTARMTMLKFRLPYSSSKQIRYPLGEIWLQPWAAVTSTETRLVVKPEAPDVYYNSNIYEEELFYHNTVRREWQFCSIPPLIAGADNCWDCCATMRIYTKYVSQYPQYYTRRSESDTIDTPDTIGTPDTSGTPDKKDIQCHAELFICRLVRRLGQSWDSPPHGKSAGVPMPSRREKLFDFLVESDRKHKKKKRR